MKIYKSHLLLLSFYVNNLLILLGGYLSYLILLLVPFYGIPKPKINKNVLLAFCPFIIFLLMKLSIGYAFSNHLLDGLKAFGIILIAYCLFLNKRIKDDSIYNFLVIFSFVNIFLISLSFFDIDLFGRSRANQVSGLFDEPSNFGLISALTGLYFLKRGAYKYWIMNLIIIIFINSLTGLISFFLLSLTHFFLSIKDKKSNIFLFLIFVSTIFFITFYFNFTNRFSNELFIIFNNINEIDLSGRGSSSQMRIIFEFLFLNEAINNASYLNLLFGSFDPIEYRTASLNGIVEIILRYGFIGLFLIIYALLYMLTKKIIPFEFILCILLIVFSTGAIYKLSFIFYVFLAYKSLTFSK